MKNRFVEHSCIVTPNYPDPWFIERGAFVERLVRVWQAEGMKVDVVAPQSVTSFLKNMTQSKHNSVNIAGDTILNPLFLSVSNKKIANVDLESISRQFFVNAAQKAMAKCRIPDFYYGQFLMNGGRAAINAGKTYNRPAFCDVGESVLINRMSKDELELARDIVQGLDGLACVSKSLMDEVIELGADPERVMYHPNTVDLNRFFPHDKAESRKQLNLPADEPIAIFTGHFIERKGPLRVLKALKQQSGAPVKGVFIGRGEQKPKGEHVLHAGPVPNEEVPVWLSAADIFVLPTLHEGHCNAINEAMACGLPVISSAIPEVENQVLPGTGILVEPADVGKISEAIGQLVTNEKKRAEMGRQALWVQREVCKENRASVILNWIKDLTERK